MRTNKFIKQTSISESERRKRKREIVIIFFVILFLVLLTVVETRVIYFGADFPSSHTILMFILINIELLLAILLIFLVFRNLAKLLYDRKHRVMGAKLRTRLVLAFISFTLLPTIVLFFFSIKFISSSIEIWFNVPIKQTLEISLDVGRQLYEHVEENNQFFLEKIAYQIDARNLMAEGKRRELSGYLEDVQGYFNIDAVEVYDPNAERITFVFGSKLEAHLLKRMSADSFYKDFKLKKVRSIFENTPKGDLTRTIGTVPFGVNHTEAEGFVILSILIPPDLSENMAAISEGFDEYQQKIYLLKEPIQITYYITMSIVALLVLFCAIWSGFHLAKTISIPIMQLAEGTRRVAEGDLSFSIASAADDEIGSLMNLFNKMTRDLRSSREQLELSAQMLLDQNVEIEERRRYMEIVLRNVSTGVITLDADGFVATANKSAEKMLNIKSDDILRQSYKKLLKGGHLDFAREIMESLAREDAVEFPLKLTIDGSPRSFIMRVNVLKDDTGRRMGAVMAFDDLTELEKAQRMAAWREVARRIAHEVKNPLTPIKLSAQRLKRRYSERLDEPVFDECTRMIIDHVDLIRNLVNEFSTFAKFPTADPKLCDLPPIIEETVALYREGHEHIHFETRMPNHLPKLHLDRRQIKQAMINLVNNAIAAIRERGTVAISLAHHPISKTVRIDVADDGPGISDEDKTRLFEPYFSTKKTGMGLGLTIVSTIVADHRGRINVQDNLPRGAKFVIELPV